MPQRAKPLPLTRQQLDASGCEIPGCDHRHDDVLVLAARCHPKANTVVTYHKATGMLKVACSVCKATIVHVLVARTNDRVLTGWG